MVTTKPTDSSAAILVLLCVGTGCSGDDVGGSGSSETGSGSSGAPASSSGVEDDDGVASTSTGVSTADGTSTGGVTDATTDASTTGGTSTGGVMEGTTQASTDTGSDSSGGSDSGTTGELMACDGDLDVIWGDGTMCPDDPVQVHQYDANTFILRQSLCTSFEAPFLYLLFGQEQVLLLDTGATGLGTEIADEVYGIIDDWLVANGQASIDLVVTHSHAHGDHVANDVDFLGEPNTVVVGSSVATVSAFFGIDAWPTEIVTYDLGGREIDVVPIPGHHIAHIALYDHASGWLLTGDTLYPGRLYIDAFPDYVESIERLVDHTAGLTVCNVMGTHIEMTSTPGVDFAAQSCGHPDEHALPLTLDHLLELRDAVVAMGDTPAYEVHDDFIVVPLGLGSGTEPWGDCMNNPESVVCMPTEDCGCDNFLDACVPATGCVCYTPGCVTADDCPPAPATGDAPPACVDLDGNGSGECILDCFSGQTCPDGMACFIDAVCGWPEN